MKTMRWLTCVAALGLTALGFGQSGLSAQEWKGLDETLSIANLKRDDLNFERIVHQDSSRMPIITRALSEPMNTYAEVMAQHEKAAGPWAAALRALSPVTLVPLGQVSTPNAIEVPDALPQPLRKPVSDLIAAVAVANSRVRGALSKLSPTEKRQLIEGLPGYAVEESSVKFGFVNGPPIAAGELLGLIGKVQMPTLLGGGVELAERIHAILPELLRAAKGVQFPSSMRFTAAGVTVAIGGTGNDVHTDRDAMIVLDLGGRDRYEGRCGAGIGYASVQIDLGGEDQYDVPDAGLGVGLCGIGLAFDLGVQDDHVDTDSLALGCGLLGVGLWVDEGGNDDYRSATLAQGFGEYGVGLMLDERGDDRYDGKLYVQGAGKTLGYGALSDKSGSDVYKAGGLILNSPLFKDVHYSFGQGFGSGYREDTGGISGGVGLLTDLGGDDAYLGETYCQGASYWYSLGSLYDGGGNDTYRAHHYAQASAMHLTAAMLTDQTGDDTYAVNFGAGHAIGHDFGVAVLIDHFGDDVYAARDSRPGIGNANGLGLFLDGSGSDRYNGPPGWGNGSRGTGSLGVFCDLGGNDQYADGPLDGGAKVQSFWGVAYDLAAASIPSAPAAQPSEAPAKPVPGNQPMPNEAEMESLYRTAIQWGVGSAQNDVQKAVFRLTEIGLPALDWILTKKAEGLNRLSLRAVVAVIQGIGDPARERIATAIAKSSGLARENLIRAAVDANVKQIGPLMPDLLRDLPLDDKQDARWPFFRLVARAAGVLGAKDAIPSLSLMAAATDRLAARQAMMSLELLADESAIGTATSLLSSSDLLTRRSAIGLFAKFPTAAMAQAKTLVGASDEASIRSGIEILSAVGSSEALDWIGKLLDHPLPGVRLQALVGLQGRVPTAYRLSIANRLKDEDPRVRALAQRLDPGK